MKFGPFIAVLLFLHNYSVAIETNTITWGKGLSDIVEA